MYLTSTFLNTLAIGTKFIEELTLKLSDISPALKSSTHQSQQQGSAYTTGVLTLMAKSTLSKAMLNLRMELRAKFSSSHSPLEVIMRSLTPTILITPSLALASHICLVYITIIRFGFLEDQTPTMPLLS